MLPVIRKSNLVLLPTLALLFTSFTLHAEVKLAALFSDNMVLQQGVLVPVWGWAGEGENVTVEFRGKKFSAKPVEGKWAVKLNKLKAGGPDTLTVSGSNTI